MIITDEVFLRQPCLPVLPGEVGHIRELLEYELKLSEQNGRPGIGLAAIQIGIPKSMAIVRVPGNNNRLYSVDLVNCKINKGYDLTFFEQEGCLSFPGRIERTKRFQEIHVISNMIEPYSFTATGLFAVCIQHELNHSEGILLPDLVK